MQRTKVSGAHTKFVEFSAHNSLILTQNTDKLDKVRQGGMSDKNRTCLQYIIYEGDAQYASGNNHRNV